MVSPLIEYVGYTHGNHEEFINVSVTIE